MQPGDNAVRSVNADARVTCGLQVFPKPRRACKASLTRNQTCANTGRGGNSWAKELHALRCAHFASRTHGVIKLCWTFNDTLRISGAQGV